MNSLVTGLARQGAEVSPATLAGTCAQAGALLAPLAEAIITRSRDSWSGSTTGTCHVMRPAGGVAAVYRREGHDQAAPGGDDRQ